MKGTPNEPFESFAGLRSEEFTSSTHHREAEQNDNSTRREYTCAEFTEALRWIDQEPFSCKVILDKFSMRPNITEPSYFTLKLDGICSSFVSSVLVGGCQHTSEGATTEEEAKENAARAAIKLILARRNNYMLESIRSNRPMGTAIHGQQSSQTSIHPAATSTPTTYIPCAPHNQLRAAVPHEQIQWRHPTAHMPFLPHKQIQWHHPTAPRPFLPHGEIQWRNPPAQMHFLPPEQMQWNSAIAQTPSEIMQMWQLPQSIFGSDSVMQNGLYSTTVQDDDMTVEVGSAEEHMTLRGTNRKMDQSECPEGKQARTSQ